MKTHFPTIVQGQLIPFMDAARKREIANIVFESIGGVARLTHIADQDPKWFYENVWCKLLPRGALATDQGPNQAGSLEDLVDRMDKMEAANNATIINGTAKESA